MSAFDIANLFPRVPPILQPGIPWPLPAPPIPVPVPRPVPVPAPVPPPGPGIGFPVPDPIPFPMAPFPNLGQAFGSLFQFEIGWGYLGAFLLVLLTVAYVESRDVDLAYAYVGILLLGIVLTNTRFRGELRSLVGG